MMRNVNTSTSAFSIVALADTTARFRDFGPYVAAINEVGTVAFTATLASGESGVFSASDEVRARSVAGQGAAEIVAAYCSHPALTGDDLLSVYVNLTDGRQGVMLVDLSGSAMLAGTGGDLTRVGPLGPTMNRSGAVAFRADNRAGEPGVFVASRNSRLTIADTGRFAAFHGLPVINERSTVVFRADQKDGRQCIMASRAGQLVEAVSTGEQFCELSAFPSLNQHEVIAFAARETSTRAGVYTVHDGKVMQVVDHGHGFDSFRGALINDAGHVFFYATRPGRPLGVYSARESARSIVALGEPLFDSNVVDFALNPVSINTRGQLAIRVTLANARQLIVRADPR